MFSIKGWVQGVAGVALLRSPKSRSPLDTLRSGIRKRLKPTPAADASPNPNHTGS